MKLVRMRVQNFKSVEDSEEFSLDQVTCLVGKNEAGKTALLEALARLNPVPGEPKNFDEEEFPRRHLATYRQREERDPAPVVTTAWTLDDADVRLLEEPLGKECLRTREVVVSKGYENVRRWIVHLDEQAIVEQLLTKHRLNAPERSQVGKATSVQELQATLKEISTPTEKLAALRDEIASSLEDGDVQSVAREVLKDQLPVFVYFANYHQLPGKVSLNHLQALKKEGRLEFRHKIFLALLEMTSTSIEEIRGIAELEKLVMELESVEAALTDEIKEYWSQNRHLEVRFRYDHAKEKDPPPFNEGFIFNTRIYNSRHRATVSFEERSHGFIWFFSFLVWFSQVRNTYGSNVVILLDEPGLPLHGRAQEDLVRYINERLRPDYQVVYTAHSPFMMDVENVFSLRTVEDVVRKREGRDDEEILGTKVGQRILSRDDDTLFPLQGILGFNVTQTLFVGPYVLVVEGPTEKVVLDWFSKQLVLDGREGLDLRWATCPAEGASKISSFVTLFAGRGLRIAVLVDYHDGQKRSVDNLEKSGLLEKDHLFRTSDYVGRDSDIEDIIGRDLYVALVAGALGLPPAQALPDEQPEDAPERVVKEVEAHCALLPPGFPEFDHYLPAAHLLDLDESEISALPDLDGALDRFETLFQDINALIG